MWCIVDLDGTVIEVFTRWVAAVDFLRRENEEHELVFLPFAEKGEVVR